MKLNQDKCHLMSYGLRADTVWAKIWEIQIWKSREHIVAVSVAVTEIWQSKWFEFW